MKRTPCRISNWLLIVMLFISGCAGYSDGTPPPISGTAPLTLTSITASPIPSSTPLPATATPAPSPVPLRTPSNLLTDDQFLDIVEKATFEYFWNEVNPATGLIKDRSTDTSPSSIAAIGFGLSTIVVGHARGWVTYEEAYQRILTTLQTLDRLQRSYDVNLYSNHGFFYHFIDPNTGQRVWNSEISSIDTALLLAGVLHAGQHFNGTEVARLTDEIYRRVDWTWMLNGGVTLSHGWKPETGFLPYRWEGYNEAAILYLLAIGSPTHPIPASSWHAWARTFQRGSYKGPEFIYVSTGSLFVYQFSHAWIDFRGKKDAYANYWDNSKRAIEANRQFVIDNSHVCKTYGENTWGLTASDGPNGYQGYGAKPGAAFHDCTIAPAGAGGSVALMPDLAIRTLRFMYDAYGEKIWGKYGYKDAFNVDKDWWDEDYIGIDQGVIILMIENYRSGLVWREFMDIPHVMQALAVAGFVGAHPTLQVTITPTASNHPPVILKTWPRRSTPTPTPTLTATPSLTLPLNPTLPPQIHLEGEAGSGDGQVMPRSAASGQRAVWLHAGEFRTFSLQLPAGACYSLSVWYSNDNSGPRETVTVSVDGVAVDSFVTQNTRITGAPSGSGWNVFNSNGPVGSVYLQPGSHEVRASVTGGDGYGVEIDVVILDRVTQCRLAPSLQMKALYQAHPQGLRHWRTQTVYLDLPSPSRWGIMVLTNV